MALEEPTALDPPAEELPTALDAGALEDRTAEEPLPLDPATEEPPPPLLEEDDEDDDEDDDDPPPLHADSPTANTATTPRNLRMQHPLRLV
jgi:hypothetical protein